MVEVSAWVKELPRALSILLIVQAQARSGIAIHDQIGLQAAGLQVGVHVGHFRYVLQRELQLLGPVAQLVQIIAQQRVLVLGIGRAAAAAAAQILHGLQERHARRRPC